MKTLKLLEQLRHCAHGCADGNCPHDRKFRAVLQEAGITLPEKPTMTACAGLRSMKTAPFNLEKALAGHPLVTRSGESVTEFSRKGPSANVNFPYMARVCGVFETFTGAGGFSLIHNEHELDLLLALPDDPPLSPEERTVIDAMRAGRKVTVEEPPKPPMPRRCWAPFLNAPRCDPWGTAFPLDRDYCGLDEQVQLIELTPEVSAALLAAGIRWEDAPTGNRLPEGVPPLPEGAVYLGVGGSFKCPKGGFGGWACRLDGRDKDKDKDKDKEWEFNSYWYGGAPGNHYAAPADSEIVRLNREPLDNPTPTL